MRISKEMKCKLDDRKYLPFLCIRKANLKIMLLCEKYRHAIRLFTVLHQKELVMRFKIYKTYVINTCNP